METQIHCKAETEIGEVLCSSHTTALGSVFVESADRADYAWEWQATPLDSSRTWQCHPFGTGFTGMKDTGLTESTEFYFQRGVDAGDMCQIKIPERSPWEAIIWIWRQSLSCNGNLNVLEIPGPWMSIKKAADTKWERKRQGKKKKCDHWQQSWKTGATQAPWSPGKYTKSFRIHMGLQEPVFDILGFFLLYLAAPFLPYCDGNVHSLPLHIGNM